VTPDPDTVTTVTIQDKQVTYSKIQDVLPVTVIGNPHATTQSAGSITAGADNRFLVRRTGQLTFDVLADPDIPATIARDSEVTASITTAIADLQAQSDPFPIYLTQTEGDARYVVLSNVLNGSVTYDPPSLASGTGVQTTINITGAALGDFVLVSFSLDLTGVVLSGWVSATNVVTARFQNFAAGTVDLASGTLRARVWKQ